MGGRHVARGTRGAREWVCRLHGHIRGVPAAALRRRLDGVWSAQLNAYIEQLLALCDHLAKGTTPPPTNPPRDFSESIPNSLAEGLITAKPPGYAFGDVLVDAPTAVTAGQTLNVTFLGGNLRADLRTHDTYVRVERHDEHAMPGQWVLVAEDSDPETRLSAHPVAAHVELTARWDVPADATPGSYRIALNASYMRDTAACAVWNTLRYSPPQDNTTNSKLKQWEWRTTTRDCQM